ncbi:MAG: HD domain-containing protein [Chloroflexota bacterium]
MTNLGYRVWQVFQAIWGKPEARDLDEIGQLCSPDLFQLFELMSPAEQAHAIRVWKAVRKSRLKNPSLEIAALLHDVGKTRRPLSVLDRVMIVLAYAFFPGRAQTWERGSLSGWRQAFTAAANHAEWGAELVSEAGADLLAAALVRKHQSALPAGFSGEEAELLKVLQQADNQN